MHGLVRKKASLAKIIFCYALDGEHIIAINLKKAKDFIINKAQFYIIFHVLYDQVSTFLFKNGNDCIGDYENLGLFFAFEYNLAHLCPNF